MDLLRLATAGSVDDGKSTLIGRLLYDSKSIFEDQLESIEQTSQARGAEQVDLALLTDGLRAEREQGITIDVAHRYFATPKRKFIIADTPGHTQYTRNMVTGASTANLAIILIDARKGILEQSRRHAFIASLLQIPHLVVAVNKMDLVDYDQEVYENIRTEFIDFATKLDIADLTFIPMSALVGDNVVDRSQSMDWYNGPTLLHHLEEVYIASDRNLLDARFPVQFVVRPQSKTHPDYRGYAGRVEGGIMRPGDEIVALPSGFTTKIKSIEQNGEQLEQAYYPMSVTVLLEDEIDISRGDMICRVNNQPKPTQDIEAMVCWMADASTLNEGSKLAIKHTTNWGRAVIKEFRYRLDINTLSRDFEAKSLELNEIGKVRMRVTKPLMADLYDRNRQTGSFILVDESTNVTVGAGMITSTE